MKQGKKNKLLLVIIVMVAVSAGAVAALPSIRQRFVEEKTEAPLKGEAVPETDMQVLQQLGNLFHRLDSVTDFEVRGSISLSDPVDGEAGGTSVFHYARLDSMVYYRLGKEEILSSKEIFIIADHEAEKLFISGPKPFNPGIFPAANQMANFLTGEGYSIATKKQGGLQWITLTRPNHITCKEYRVGFSEDGFIRETFMRLTDQRDPLNTEKDRTVRTKADEWNVHRPAASLFDVSRFVQKRSGAYVAAGSFASYQLIQTQ